MPDGLARLVEPGQGSRLGSAFVRKNPGECMSLRTSLPQASAVFVLLCFPSSALGSICLTLSSRMAASFPLGAQLPREVGGGLVTGERGNANCSQRNSPLTQELHVSDEGVSLPPFRRKVQTALDLLGGAHVGRRRRSLRARIRVQPQEKQGGNDRGGLRLRRNARPRRSNRRSRSGKNHFLLDFLLEAFHQ